LQSLDRREVVVVVVVVVVDVDVDITANIFSPKEVFHYITAC
jgi:hypothetical protein